LAASSNAGACTVNSWTLDSTAPEVKALAHEMAGKAVILKVDTEEHQQLASKFGVQSIPNFVVLRNGKVVSRHAGLAPRADMRRWLA